ncbi:hypothetical protein KXW78_005880 [Aspergillus fumigatus]|nr:hypothetical protein KXW78_005880 [Aspergillus fumigatus]
MSMLKVARIPVHGRSLSFLMDTCHENLQSYAEEIQDLVVRLENDIPELRPIRALVPVSNSYVEVAVTSEGENAVYERYGPPSYELFSDQDPAIDDCLLINPSWEPYPGDIKKELQVVEETLADVQKIKEMVNKVIGEASTLGQHLSTRRELLWDHRNDQMYITSKDTSISRTPEACSHYLHELRPPCESEIATYLNGGASNAGIQPSQFANSAPPKHDGSLVLPTEVVPMDLSDGHHGAPGFASIANIITPTRNTESFTPINDERRLPVFIKRLVTALNDQENQQIMRWSEDGNTVVIVDEQELTTKLLPDFNTTTYFSFTQQLRLHGFRKVENGYEHPLFRRDLPQDTSPGSISTPASSAGYGSARSSPNHVHPLSAGNGVSNAANSHGQSYKVVKRGRRPKTHMQAQQYNDWDA